MLLIHLHRCLDGIRQMLARARERRQLCELLQHDTRLLKDMGITWNEAMHEASKPFWRK
jgi:uncharacterized protein YjiS (DUF1127 family)